MTRYWEDFEVGRPYDLGSTTVTQDEIVRFAIEFDPQPFHVDPEAAQRSAFKGLIASGWHTCAIFQRLCVESLLTETANVVGLGVDKMSWKVPVRPGDSLRAQAAVLRTRVSRSNPSLGIVEMQFELWNQREELVWHATCSSLMERKP
jgi:acyl dehydratase